MSRKRSKAKSSIMAVVLSVAMMMSNLSVAATDQNETIEAAIGMRIVHP